MRKGGEKPDIGLLIKKRRKELKISQEKLGEMIGVSYQQVQKYESGRDKIRAERLQDIASALNTDIAYFFEKHGAFEVREETPVYNDLQGLSPDEKELIRSFRAIEDMEYRKLFLCILAKTANRDRG